MSDRRFHEPPPVETCSVCGGSIVAIDGDLATRTPRGPVCIVCFFDPTRARALCEASGMFNLEVIDEWLASGRTFFDEVRGAALRRRAKREGTNILMRENGGAR